MAGGASAKASTYDGKAYDKTAVMNFEADQESAVKEYYHYSDLASQKRGEPMKKYLYDIISSDNHFVSYKDVGAWYKITDRNWELSQQIAPETYRFAEDTGEKHYQVMMYFENSANQDPKKAINNALNGYAEDNSLTEIDWANSKKPNSSIQVDKEHVWAKSHGFEGDPVPNAGTDLHHLVAADHNTNSAGHNNLDYGEVKDKNSAKKIYCYYADGTTGVSGWRGEGKNGLEVFEPTDEWKGNVARALFYMATRYGIKTDSNSKAEPYLRLTDDINDQDDNETFSGVQHNLDTFLAWNEADPVDEYEYRRNCLIYNNVQKNRNPFVDYPNLASVVFDSNETGSYSLRFWNAPVIPDYSEVKNSYNAYYGQDYDLKIRGGDPEKRTFIYDAEEIEVDKKKGVFKPLKEGDFTLQIKETYEEEGEIKQIEKTVQIRSKKLPEFDLTHQSEYELEEGSSMTLQLALPTPGYENERVEVRVSDLSVVELKENSVTGLKIGECDLEIVLTGGEKEIILSKIHLRVQMSKKKLYIMIIVIAAALLIGIFLLFFFLIKAGDKKRKKIAKKVYSNAKKAVKKQKKNRK